MCVCIFFLQYTYVCVCFFMRHLVCIYTQRAHMCRDNRKRPHKQIARLVTTATTIQLCIWVSAPSNLWIRICVVGVVVKINMNSFFIVVHNFKLTCIHRILFWIWQVLKFILFSGECVDWKLKISFNRAMKHTNCAYYFGKSPNRIWAFLKMFS